jgi:stage V sporulation protein SpoVS
VYFSSSGGKTVTGALAGYSREQRERIIDAIEALCIAKAKLWDALRDVEVSAWTEAATELEIETDHNLEGILAAEYNTPPQYGDVSRRVIWRHYLRNARVNDVMKGIARD